MEFLPRAPVKEGVAETYDEVMPRTEHMSSAEPRSVRLSWIGGGTGDGGTALVGGTTYKRVLHGPEEREVSVLRALMRRC